MAQTSDLMETLDHSIEKKEELIDKNFMKYATRSILATVFLGLGSAIAIGLGLKFDGSIGKVAYAIAFGLGLMLIIFLNAELGTSNMMYMTVAVYRKKLKLSKAVKILFVCVLFNLIGAIVMAYFLSLTSSFKGLDPHNFLVHIIEGKIEKNWIQTIIEGIFANIVVNLAVVMSMKVKGDAGRIMAIILVIFIFTFLSFEHVIANFIYFPLAYFSTGTITGMTVGAVCSNLVFTFIGNYIGGGLVIGLTYAWLNNNERLEYLD